MFPDSCKGVTINGHSVQTLRVIVMDYSRESARDMTINCPHGTNTLCLIKSDSYGSFWSFRVNADDTDTLIMIGNQRYSFIYADIYATNARKVYIYCLEGGCRSMHLNMNSVCITYYIGRLFSYKINMYIIGQCSIIISRGYIIYKL